MKPWTAILALLLSCMQVCGAVDVLTERRRPKNDEKMQSSNVLRRKETFSTFSSSSQQLRSLSLTVKGNDGEPSDAYPLGQCEGDCDDDDECAAGLVCFQRDSGDEVPGCDGEDDLGEEDLGNDFCILDPDRPQLVDEDISRHKKLDKCEGDCDLDNDCHGSLLCFQRDATEPVPGCQGEGELESDYCYDPMDTPNGYGEKFRLKMYWEEHYYWQNQKHETFWCMECYQGDKEDSDCKIGDKVYVKNCDEDNTYFQLVEGDDGTVHLHLADTYYCLSAEEKGDYVYVEQCDLSDDRQKFTAGGGDFDSWRFELKSVAVKGACLSQDHHPKEEESVFVETCSRAREAHTSYWVKY